MDTDYEGQLYIHNELVTGQMDAQLSKIRNEKIGFVFQFHLLMEYNVLKT
jgi:lipoprotein-releasing system ATP-binding protein